MDLKEIVRGGMKINKLYILRLKKVKKSYFISCLHRRQKTPMLGHAQASTTLNFYAHALPSHKKESMEKMSMYY